MKASERVLIDNCAVCKRRVIGASFETYGDTVYLSDGTPGRWMSSSVYTFEPCGHTASSVTVRKYEDTPDGKRGFNAGLRQNMDKEYGNVP